jgi:trans-aconitate 2-methyltransferase
MRPYLSALGTDGPRFFEEYASGLRRHYPMRADGVTLLPFRRLFLVAVL